MPLLNAWKLEGRRLVAALGPGERVLAFTPTTLGPIEPALPKALQPRPDQPEGRSPFWKALGVLDSLVPSLRPLDKLADSFTNESISGDETSLARTLGRQIDRASGKTYLAVTERHLHVLHDPSTSATAPLVPVVTVERMQVRTAEVRAHGTSRGRLRITFADASWLEFADQLNMGRGRAAEIRDALTNDRSSVDGEPGPAIRN